MSWNPTDSRLEDQVPFKRHIFPLLVDVVRQRILRVREGCLILCQSVSAISPIPWRSPIPSLGIHCLVHRGHRDAMA